MIDKKSVSISLPPWLIQLVEKHSTDKEFSLRNIAVWIYNGPFAFFKIIASVITIFTSLFFFFYALGYCFVYGYFLSGNIDNTPSLLSLSINPVPINFYSILIISVFLFLSSFTLCSMIFVPKEKKLIVGIVMFFCLIFLHIALSIFFIPGSDIFQRAGSFVIIWILPILLAILILIFLTFMKDTFIFISSILYVWISWTIIDLFLKEKINLILELSTLFENQSLFAVMLSLLTSFALTKILKKMNIQKYDYLFHSAIIFPFVCIAFLLFTFLFHLFFDHFFAEGILILFLVITVSLILPKIKKISLWLSKNLEHKHKLETAHASTNKEEEQTDPPKQDDSNQKESKGLANKKEQERLVARLFMIFIPCALLLFVALASFISLVTGNYVRTFSSENLRKIEIIEDYKNNIEIKGNLIKVEGNTYYISDLNWNLKILRSDSISVRTLNE